MTSSFGSISGIQTIVGLGARASPRPRAPPSPRAISCVSGAPAQSTTCIPGSQMPDGAHQVEDPLLPRDAADEEHDRHVAGRRPSAPERRRRRARAVLVGVDAVVDDADALGRHAVERLHVLLHRLGHGDDAVGVLVGGALDPGRRVVGAAELLDLPGPVRLERVRGQHQPRAGELPREAAGEVRVPGVAVDDVRRHRPRRPSPGRARARRAACAWRGSCAGSGSAGGDAVHAQVAVRLVLLAEAEHVHLVRAALGARQLAREILDVDARAAVDVRRVFVGEQGDAHERRARSRCRRRSRRSSR